VSVCLSVAVGVLLKRLNTLSPKQRRTIVQGVKFWRQRPWRNYIEVIPNGVAKYTWGGKNSQLSTNNSQYISKTYKTDVRTASNGTLPMTSSDPNHPKCFLHISGTVEARVFIFCTQAGLSSASLGMTNYPKWAWLKSRDPFLNSEARSAPHRSMARVKLDVLNSDMVRR